MTPTVLVSKAFLVALFLAVMPAGAQAEEPEVLRMAGGVTVFDAGESGEPIKAFIGERVLRDNEGRCWREVSKIDGYRTFHLARGPVVQLPEITMEVSYESCPEMLPELIPTIAQPNPQKRGL